MKEDELLEYLELGKDAFKKAVKKSKLISRQKTGELWIEYEKRIEQAYIQIVALIKKPEVTKEWIRGWAKILEDDSPEGKLLLLEIEELLKQMLTEAGVSITVDRGSK